MTKDAKMMSQNITREIINELINSETGSMRKAELEKQLEQYPSAYKAWLKYRNDYSEVFNSSHIPANPFFLAKLKNRMEERKQPKPVFGKVQWAPYAALASLALVFGVFLGNQVDYTQEPEADSFTDEFVISDYELDDTFLLGMNLESNDK